MNHYRQSRNTSGGGFDRRELAPPDDSTAALPVRSFHHSSGAGAPSDVVTIERGSEMSVPRHTHGAHQDTRVSSHVHMLSELDPPIEGFIDADRLRDDPDGARREWLLAHATAAAWRLLDIASELDAEHPYAEALRALTRGAEQRSMA